MSTPSKDYLSFSRDKRTLVIAFLLITGCIPANRSSTAAPSPSLTKFNSPPLTITYLDGQSLVFECLEKEDCTQRIDLSKMTSLDTPYQLGAAYFIDPVNTLVWLYSIGANHSAVLSVNRKTGEFKQRDLPGATFEGIIAHGRLILRDIEDSTIYIIQNDLSVRAIHLESDVFQLIEADDNKIIAVNHQPFTQNGLAFIRTYIIDVQSGEYLQESISSPAFTDPLNLPEMKSNDDTLAGWLITVSADLKYVYLFYNHRNGDESYQQAIGMFDTRSLDEVNYVRDPTYITFLNRSVFLSLQYRNISYPRTAFTDTEGIYQGLSAPMNLSTLSLLVDTKEIIKKEYINKLRFAPFGDYFVIGTNSRVILISLNGETMAEYPLPREHIPLANGIWEYSILEYYLSSYAPYNER